MPKTTVTPGDYVEFDHPVTKRVEYGNVIHVDPHQIAAIVRTGSGEEFTLYVRDLYEPMATEYAAA